MVKVCEGHKNFVQYGCTYQIVDSGITNKPIGIKIGGGLYIKDSECEVCNKLRQLHELTDMVDSAMIHLGLTNKHNHDNLFSSLCKLVDLKLREHW